MSKVGVGWSSSTALNKSNIHSKNDLEGIPDKDVEAQRPARRSIIQRITGMGPKPQVAGETGRRMCGSVIKFNMNRGLHDIEGTNQQSNEDRGEIRSDEKHVTSKSQDSTEGKPNNYFVSVYFHKRSQCYEVDTYDITTFKELNRIYIRAESVKDITDSTKKRSRMSFISGQAADKKLSVKFAQLMSFTMDANGRLCVDILRADRHNSRRKASIACPRPETVTPATMDRPSFQHSAPVLPKKRRTILQQLKGRISLFGGKKAPPIAPIATMFDPAAEAETEVDFNDSSSSGSMPRYKISNEVPSLAASSDLSMSQKYEKSVDVMLHEAAGMREALKAKRAAEGEGGRFGKKKKKVI